MNQHAALASTVTTAEPDQSTTFDRPIVPWTSVFIAIVIVCTALVIDSSLTSEQRIALLAQSGIFP
jgi:hypothetical protein